jgi:hypothetical protein
MFGKLSDKYVPTVPRLPLPCGILSFKFGRLNVVFAFLKRLVDKKSGLI